MKVREVSVAIDRKVNLGNYESLGIHIGMTVVVPEEELYYSEHIDEAWADLKEIVEEKIEDYLETMPDRRQG